MRDHRWSATPSWRGFLRETTPRRLPEALARPFEGRSNRRARALAPICGPNGNAGAIGDVWYGKRPRSRPFAGKCRARAAGPNDAQIAAIVVTAGQVDIDAGQWAESHAASADVKTFAAPMVADHTAVNKAATDLAGRLHLAPDDNATAQSLKKGGDDNAAHLKTLMVKERPASVAHLDHAKHLQAQLGK